MLILRGANFGSVVGASGVQGTFGEGYWFHNLPRPLSPKFTGMTFVAKTMTAFEHEGNMPYDRHTMRPKEFFPRCIVIRSRHGVMLNAVGLSNPGCVSLIIRDLWQRRTDPHMLSFMAIGKDSAMQRLKETEYFSRTLALHLWSFRAPIALQVNFSCPNVGLNPMHLIGEVGESLGILRSLNIPLIPKFNITLPPEVAVSIARDSCCDAICISNTIPWKDITPQLKLRAFGSEKSPLERFGGGGLSGRPLLPAVKDWITDAVKLGVSKPIIAGGGILEVEDALSLMRLGAAAVSIGSMASLRPWNVQPTIRAVNNYSA